jgi:GDPmannose 4,6-dehydratase
MDWREYVDIDPRLFRPAEVDLLLGDATKARERLGWAPKTSFQQLVRIMTDADMALARREAAMAAHHD